MQWQSSGGEVTMDKLKEFDAKQFVEKFIEESVGDFIAFEELALAAYTYGVEQALATLEQPQCTGQVGCPIHPGLSGPHIKPPSVRPVTGNAPPRCPACGGEMPCNFCGTPDPSQRVGN
jgi:hypothetical protein